MAEKLKPVKPPTSDAERKAWGRMAPPKYKDGLGKRVGGWLAGLLSGWWR